MKFALTLCFAACFIASLQVAAVDPLELPPGYYYMECDKPQEIGSCTGQLRRYAYNAESHRCEEFAYGGCGGNKNNFDSLGACEFTCIKFV
ncbi:kappaPI-actitoxin-Avd3d-like [Zeugodacus cucurbitae]|uniref:kappaPI-actitoxin-Avd3d-like n=1 Tax=Zeugodacus cucurbitae TaxID=28588 RepID=UPI0023D9677D|nr:kappaPI-actitoxin-Avd3d-like [Zeugodacus cucurbitae]